MKACKHGDGEARMTHHIVALSAQASSRAALFFAPFALAPCRDHHGQEPSELQQQQRHATLRRELQQRQPQHRRRRPQQSII